MDILVLFAMMNKSSWEPLAEMNFPSFRSSGQYDNTSKNTKDKNNFT